MMGLWLVNYFVLMPYSKSNFDYEPRVFYKLLTRVLAGLICTFFWAASINYLPLSIATTVFNTTPFWTAILANFMLKE
jgi:drug/metabolite transporter (DMT)-like permease